MNCSPPLLQVFDEIQLRRPENRDSLGLLCRGDVYYCTLSCAIVPSIGVIGKD